MEISDFSNPTRQSSKGILVIFALNSYKFIRNFFVLFVGLIWSISKKETNSFFSTTNIGVLIIGTFMVILVIAILKYRNFKFHLDKDEFHLSTGIINKNATIIPKSKIQNVYIKQNLIQQIINVVSLNIETAGDEASEIEINALDRDIALQLKKQLFSTNEVADSELKEKQTQNSIFFKASLKRLFLEGISQNHIKSLLIIVSFISGLYYEFGDYIKDLSVADRFESFMSLQNGSFLDFILSNLLIVVVAIFISMVFSVIQTLVSNYDLEVVENQDTIEINKGLFNKLSLILTPVKIQNLVIKTNRLKMYFGLHTVSIKQAMVSTKQQKNFKIVALEKHQAERFVQNIFNRYDEEGDYHKPDVYYKRLLMIRAISIGALINIPAFFLLGNYFWFINFISLPWIIMFVHFTFKKASYQITDEYLTINSGFIDRIRNVSELHKIQSVEIKQSIFQKRKNIASLHIATASDEVKIPYIKEHIARSIYDYLLFKVESQDKSWM